MSTRVLQFSTIIRCTSDEVGRVLVPEDSEGFFESVLFDQTMTCEVPT